jgi:hypothetical protein
MGPKLPWIADGAFSTPLSERDSAIRRIVWGVTSQFANFVSHLSSALFRTVLLTLRVTQFIAVLHAGSLVSCHYFLSFLLCLLGQIFSISGLDCSFSSRQPVCRGYRGCKVTCRFISCIRIVNFYIWGYEFRGEALKQLPVCFSTLLVGDFEPRMSVTMTSDSRAFWCATMSRTSPLSSYV